MLVDEYLERGRIERAGILDAGIVSNVVRDFYAGDSKLTTRLWYLLAFEMWREKWA